MKPLGVLVAFAATLPGANQMGALLPPRLTLGMAIGEDANACGQGTVLIPSEI